MLADAIALARVGAPTGAATPSLAQAEAETRSATRLRDSAPLLGLALGTIAVAVLSARWARDRS
jgi:hypothetical protein